MQTLHPEVPCSFSVVRNLCSSTLFFYVSFVHPFANTRHIQHQGARVMQGSFHLYEEHVGLELRDGHVPRSGRTNLSNVAQ